MKCYKCNGTGYYDIDNECPVCDGTGEYKPFDLDVELDKLYPTELTNEDWLRSCNTEQLAEEIYECVMTHPWHISKEVILEWLKQPHTPISLHHENGFK